MEKRLRRPLAGDVVRVRAKSDAIADDIPFLFLHTGEEFRFHPVYIVPSPANTREFVLGGSLVGKPTIDTSGHLEAESADNDYIERILERCRALVPALRGDNIEICGSHRGFRPMRTSEGGPLRLGDVGRPGFAGVRVERTESHPKRSGVPVVSCYGHGGAGVTLSWGSAGKAAELAISATHG